MGRAPGILLTNIRLHCDRCNRSHTYIDSMPDDYEAYLTAKGWTWDDDGQRCRGESGA